MEISRKILSFDVGIKNLAFCIINKTGSQFKIEDWGIINLDDDRKLCHHILTTKNLCNKSANLIITHNNAPLHVCKTHYKKYTKIVDTSTDIMAQLENKTCVHQLAKKLCGKKAEQNLEDTGALCATHYKFHKKILDKKNAPTKISTKNCNKISLDILSSKLFTKLDTYASFLTVNDVVIENQPSLINPTMKTISAMLYSYFTIRGIVDKVTTKSIIETIRFISPSNKLKVNITTTLKSLTEKLVAPTKRDIYVLTKELGVEYCKALIESDKEKTTLLSTHEKQDDMCDAFLQGFYCLFTPSGIPENYRKLLDKATQKVIDAFKTKKTKATKVTSQPEAKKKKTKSEAKPEVKKKKAKSGITVTL